MFSIHFSRFYEYEFYLDGFLFSFVPLTVGTCPLNQLAQFIEQTTSFFVLLNFKMISTADASQFFLSFVLPLFSICALFSLFGLQLFSEKIS